MHDPTFTIKLRQHSPMIHFQHRADIHYSDTTAILRASDLKPRLDRFLRLDSKQTRYRLCISGMPSFDQDRTSFNYESYFGNQSKSKENRIVKISSINNLRLEINTLFNDKLREVILNNIDLFLAYESFGTRNDKGYGCFYNESATITDFNNALQKLKSEKRIGEIYFWDCDPRLSLIVIATFNRWLKSGLNVMGAYYKSLLYCYCFAHGIKWDKRIVKERLLSPPAPVLPVNHTQISSNAAPASLSSEHFVRVLLGLSTYNTWSDSQHHLYENYLNMERPVLKVTSTNAKVARVPSLLIFKIFKSQNSSRVYMFLSKDREAAIQREIIDAQPEFIFQFMDALGQRKSATFLLKPPSSFDFDDFLDYAVTEIQNTTAINPPPSYFPPRRERVSAEQKTEYLVDLLSNISVLHAGN